MGVWKASCEVGEVEGEAATSSMRRSSVSVLMRWVVRERISWVVDCWEERREREALVRVGLGEAWFCLKSSGCGFGWCR